MNVNKTIFYDAKLKLVGSFFNVTAFTLMYLQSNEAKIQLRVVGKLYYTVTTVYNRYITFT